MLYFRDNLPENAGRFFSFFQVSEHFLLGKRKTKSSNHKVTQDSGQKQKRTLTMAEAIMTCTSKRVHRHNLTEQVVQLRYRFQFSVSLAV